MKELLDELDDIAPGILQGADKFTGQDKRIYILGALRAYSVQLTRQADAWQAALTATKAEAHAFDRWLAKFGAYLESQR